jgi:hypothetical protein
MTHRLASLGASSSTRPQSAGLSAAEARPELWARRAISAALLVVGLIATGAFFTTLRPPLQDLPQHLATARVLLDPEHSGFRFREFFDVDWMRSQYLGTYMLLGAFFYPLRLFTEEPLLWANRCLLVALTLAWPLSTELVYRKLCRRAGLGAWSLVLFFNVHLILGFLNFLLGIVACFTALACLAEARARERRAEPQRLVLAAWGVAALACFYLHVVPFALLLAVVGVSVSCEQLWPSLWASLRRTPRPRGRPGSGPLLAFVPAAVACLGWLFTPAGMSTREAALGSGARGRAVYQSFEVNRSELQNWLVDSFASPWDTRWALVAFATFGVWLLAELGRRAWLRRRVSMPTTPPPGASQSRARGDDAPDLVLSWTLRAFVPLSFVLYFALPSAYDWIWPINARFPLFGLLFLPLWLPAAGPPTRAGWQLFRAAAVVLLLGAAGAESWVARDAFAGFAREMRGFDELLASIPPGQRTATLVFNRYSREVGFAPFLHVGSYYQAERGGVSFFSFADFPQSPVRFRPDRRPPPARPRWEWMPERVRVDRDLAWFDVVITCGGPGRIESSRVFEPAGRFGRFRLFRKREAAQRPQ